MSIVELSTPVKAPGVTIDDLTVSYGGLAAVSGVSFRLEPGTITGLVGESGSGKSTLALSLLGAVQKPGQVTGGAVVIDGIGDMTKLDKEALRRVRGVRIGYVFQAAQNSLNPLKTVGKQLLDLAKSHHVKDVREAKPLLERMGLNADRVLNSYQHELSGGMRQRVGIMFALVLNAHVLVLDEPTTALDMITQANILQIVREMHADRGLTTLVVTHDVGVVAEVTQRIAVMYGGRIVEHGATMKVLAEPRHPYTRGLINAIPRLTGNVDEAQPLPGTPPTLGTIARTGCVFRQRCPLRMDICDTAHPETIDGVACHAVNPPAGHATPTGQGRPTGQSELPGDSRSPGVSEPRSQSEPAGDSRSPGQSEPRRQSEPLGHGEKGGAA